MIKPTTVFFSLFALCSLLSLLSPLDAPSERALEQRDALGHCITDWFVRQQQQQQQQRAKRRLVPASNRSPTIEITAVVDLDDPFFDLLFENYYGGSGGVEIRHRRLGFRL